MNDTVTTFMRETLKEGLATRPPAQQLLFKRMYSHGDLEKEIHAVVDDMENEKLDWAMQQVQRSIDRENKDGKTDET